MCKTIDHGPRAYRNRDEHWYIDEKEHARRTERNAKRVWPWGYVRSPLAAVRNFLTTSNPRSA